MSPGTASPAEPLEWSSIPVGGVHTRLVQAGPHQASEAVVFIHGNPGSASDWVGLVEETGRIGRAVAFDLPDFGQTVAEPGFGNTVHEYAEFVGRALETLGITDAQLVLHDFGGPIGLTWAAANTERVAGVTLIDTGVLLDYKWHRTARIWQTPGLGELLNMAANRAVFRRLVSSPEPRGLPAAFIDEMYDNLDRRTRSAVLRLYRDQKKIGWSHRWRRRTFPRWSSGEVAIPTFRSRSLSARRRPFHRLRSMSFRAPDIGPSLTTPPPSPAC